MYLCSNFHRNYEIFCCKGISLDILKRLSEDLSFQYVIYLLNDTDYGEVRDGRWTGMVGDVISGSADLIVGAFSMTSSRMAAISYTEPFYQNEFALVTGKDGRSQSIWAFLSPFSAEVCVVVVVVVVVDVAAVVVVVERRAVQVNPGLP